MHACIAAGGKASLHTGQCILAGQSVPAGKKACPNCSCKWTIILIIF